MRKTPLILLVVLSLCLEGCTGPGAWDLFGLLDNGGPSKKDVLEGLAARYTFDSAALLAADSSGNGNDGTPGVAPADMWVNDPIRGGVLEFDGATEYVAIPYLGDRLAAITISAWVNLAGIDTWEPIYDADGWNTGWIHFQIKGNGKLQFTIKDSDPQYVDSLFVFTAGEYGQWHHIAAVHDTGGGNLSFYVDGGLDYSVPLIAPLAGNLWAGRIGGWDGGRWFNGRMDDVRFYGRGLSAAEVATLYDVTR